MLFQQVQQFTETRALGPGPADAVGVLAHDVKAALGGQRAKVVKLCFRMLVKGRDPEIKRGALHKPAPTSSNTLSIWCSCRSRSSRFCQLGCSRQLSSICQATCKVAYR